jgi:hypothetical protein
MRDDEQEFSAEADGYKAKPLYDGDCGRLPLELRRVLVALLRGPYLFRSEKACLWQDLVKYQTALRERLSELFLELIIDEEIGVAFLRQADTGEIDAPSLLNTYSYRFLDSVLLIEMRERLMRASQSGERAVISLDEIESLLGFYEPASKNDLPKFKLRVSAVIKRLKDRHLLLSLGKGRQSSFEVSPVLRVVFDAKEIERLKAAYEALLARAATGSSGGPLTDAEDGRDMNGETEE